MKRLFDILFSFVPGLFFLPIAGVFAIGILLTIGRPILFVQYRTGLRGRIFRLYKFRTMKDVNDSNQRNSSDIDRLTRLGKFMRKWSIDELPELFNILKGDMSLVGPRPLLQQYIDRYTPEQARRHEVKPGLTGWAQIHGRNAITWEEKFALDVWYVDHWSLWLDMKIIARTVIKVIRSEGISASGEATMPEFMGTDNPKTRING